MFVRCEPKSPDQDARDFCGHYYDESIQNSHCPHYEKLDGVSFSSVLSPAEMHVAAVREARWFSAASLLQQDRLRTAQRRRVTTVRTKPGYLH